MIHTNRFPDPEETLALTISQLKEPMSRVDRAWLRMDRPTNLMMINGVVILEGPVDYARLIETIEQRFLAFRRFGQRAVDRGERAYWMTDADFDIREHVLLRSLPGVADRQELEALVSELAGTPLNPARPLWQFHLVENYVGGPALIMRIHHCIADGIALVQVFLSLTDPGRESRPSAGRPKVWKERRAQEAKVFRRLLEPARQGLDFALHAGRHAGREACRMMKNPAVAGNYVLEGGEIIAELLHSLTLSRDPVTRFKGKLGVSKRVAWTEPLPLAEVKAVSRAFDCTVNDVLIAAVTGALRRYMLECGDRPGDLVDIRATVPVNLRPLEHAKELGNQFGLVFLPLPLSLDSPLQRLYAVNASMRELKSSKQAAVTLGVLAALGMVPSALQKTVLDILSEKASAVLTNVPGPSGPLYLAGSELKELMFWVPQNGSVGIGISILSYNGKVFFGLITDRRLVAEPTDIISRFGMEYRKFLYLSLMLPLEGRPDAKTADELLQHSLQSGSGAG